MKLQKLVDVHFSVSELADAFCQLDDDGQAQFFVAVSSIFRSWCKDNPLAFDFQAQAIGEHLKICECSTEDAREFIRTIVDAITTDP